MFKKCASVSSYLLQISSNVVMCQIAYCRDTRLEGLDNELVTRLCQSLR